NVAEEIVEVVDERARPRSHTGEQIGARPRMRRGIPDESDIHQARGHRLERQLADVEAGAERADSEEADAAPLPELLKTARVLARIGGASDRQVEATKPGDGVEQLAKRDPTEARLRDVGDAGDHHAIADAAATAEQDA